MARQGLDKASRQTAAKAGTALPNGKYPIRTRGELNAAIKLRHHSTENYAVVKAHILKRAAALGIKVKASRLASADVEEFYGKRTSREQMRRRSSDRSIRGRDPSLRWPHLYDILRAKGYDKEKAARISNSRLRYRKKGRLEGLPWKKADSKKELRKLLKASALVASVYDEVTGARGASTAPKVLANSVVFACLSRACAPPPVGTGGSRGTSLSQASRAKALLKGKHAAANTSAYPVDTIKTTRASDKNPLAPGHADRSAVRGHKGIHGTDPERRIPHAGETVDIYRDLGHGRAHKRGFPDDMAFSVRHASGMPGSQQGLVVASTTGVILNNGRPSWAHSAKAQAEVAGKRGVHGFIRGEVQEYVNPDKLSAMVKSDPSWKKVTYYPGTQDFFDPKTRDRFVGSDQVALVNGEFFAKNPQYVSGNPTPVSPIERKLGLVSSASTVVFACHSKACAPPPVGVGGSSGKGKRAGFDKISIRHARGKEATYKGQSVTIGRSRMIEKGGGRGNQTMVEITDSVGKTFEVNMRSLSQKPVRGKFPEIGAEGIRGDSKPVSSAEFQRLANIGQDKLDRLQANSKPIKGLDDNWDTLKVSSHAEAMKEWGGATINAHTGEVLPQGVNKWAMTIKDKGVETVSIPQDASREEFDAAMDLAKERFRPILEREGSHLGVFHDDDLGRIDFDPVLVVDTLDDVHTIGAATRAIGGAYNFADGNGYWPPHVAEGA